MKNLIIICCIGLLAASCHQDKKPLFKEFEFSMGSGQFINTYTYKFTQSDTIFIKQHFIVSEDTFRKDIIYFAIMANGQKHLLDSFINSTDFSKFDTAYYQSDYSYGEYWFYLKNDNIDKSIYVHTHDEPEQLRRFAHWIVTIHYDFKYHQIDTVINFHEPHNVVRKQLIIKSSSLKSED